MFVSIKSTQTPPFTIPSPPLKFNSQNLQELTPNYSMVLPLPNPQKNPSLSLKEPLATILSPKALLISFGFYIHHKKLSLVLALSNLITNLPLIDKVVAVL